MPLLLYLALSSQDKSSQASWPFSDHTDPYWSKRLEIFHWLYIWHIYETCTFCCRKYMFHVCVKYKANIMLFKCKRSVRSILESEMRQCYEFSQPLTFLQNTEIKKNKWDLLDVSVEGCNVAKYTQLCTACLKSTV